MSGFIDYYELLEVSPRASREVIELAYKAIAKKYHPDLNDSSKREFYNIKMSLINEARTVLTDTYKRSQYDYKYRSQQIKYSDKSQTNRANTSSYSKPEPNPTPKSNSDHAADKQAAEHSSSQIKRKAKSTYKKEGNAFEYFSIPLAIILIIAVGIIMGTILTGLFSRSNSDSVPQASTNLASNSTIHPTSNDTHHTTIETTEIPHPSDFENSIAASDTAEYIKENIVSISDFSWKLSESGSTEFDIDFRNNSSKTIDSITIKIIIQDKNKITLASTDDGATAANLLLTGPIEPHAIGGLGKYWNNVFTNKNAATCYLDSIYITYEDGTTYNFNARRMNLFEK